MNVQDDQAPESDPLSRLPSPEPGEVRIVVLDGANTFLAHAQRIRCDEIMDAFEKRAGLTQSARSSRETHASIRIDVARGLRTPDAEARFTDVLAAAVMWLAMRHWSDGRAIARGVDDLIEQGRTPVMTAAIADPDGGRFMPDTAWSFMVGERIHDGRDQLRTIGPEEVRIIGGGT